MTLIKQRLHIEPVCTPGKTGQFDVIADGERIAERGGNWFTQRFGAGYPDLEKFIEHLVEKNRAGTGRQVPIDAVIGDIDLAPGTLAF